MIILAFGANLPGPYGGPESNIQKAISLLPGRGIEVISVSGFWRTRPVPESGQPWFYNAAALVRSYLAPQELLQATKALEREFGRLDDERNAPRVLDIDLISYDDLVMEEDGLVLPHPRMHERGFVLYPLQEIVGEEWKHPVCGLRIGELIENLPASQMLETPTEIAA